VPRDAGLRLPATRVHSCDADFNRFKGLRVENPLR
jgi:hypothetical protein